ncbi:PAS domain S-box protein [bacterium]|nr:PAS domain S-box protein [bacterium]
MKKNLENGGVLVAGALDFPEGIDEVFQKKPDQIILAIEGFKRETFEILNRLKEKLHPLTNLIVFYSGDELYGDDLNCAKGICDELVHKSITPDELISRIRIHHREQHFHKSFLISEKRYQQLLESYPDAILFLSPEGQLLFHNQRLPKMLKGQFCEPLLGREINTLFPISDLFKEIFSLFERAKETDSLVSGETQLIVSNGRGINLELIAMPILEECAKISIYQIVIRDITHRRRMEEALLQAEKINALGILTAGIAHEINNPLTAVSSAVQILKKDGVTPKRREELCDLVLTHVGRIVKIVKDLRIFSRPSQGSISEVFSVQDAISETLALTKYQVDESRIKLNFELSDEILTIYGNRNQFQQVMINLLVNAIQAIEKNGTISVQTQKQGFNAVVIIEDTGCGIPSSELGKIFDPFYSTKRNWTGTGLGLAVSYRIIQIFKGTIAVSSGLDKGTRFKITLPLYQPPLNPRQKKK